MTAITTRIRKHIQQQQWGATCGTIRGFYLCVKVDGVETKYWFAATLQQARAKLEKACDQWLTAKNGWRYGVEYSHGLDVAGRVAWGNINIVDQVLA